MAPLAWSKSRSGAESSQKLSIDVGGKAMRIGLQYGHDLRRLRDRELLMALLHW